MDKPPALASPGSSAGCGPQASSFLKLPSQAPWPPYPMASDEGFSPRSEVRRGKRIKAQTFPKECLSQRENGPLEPDSGNRGRQGRQAQRCPPRPASEGDGPGTCGEVSTLAVCACPWRTPLRRESVLTRRDFCPEGDELQHSHSKPPPLAGE